MLTLLPGQLKMLTLLPGQLKMLTLLPGHGKKLVYQSQLFEGFCGLCQTFDDPLVYQNSSLTIHNCRKTGPVTRSFYHVLLLNMTSPHVPVWSLLQTESSLVSLRQHTHQGLPTSDTQVPCVPVHTRVRTLKHLTPTVQGTLPTGL